MDKKHIGFVVVFLLLSLALNVFFLTKSNDVAPANIGTAQDAISSQDIKYTIESALQSELPFDSLFGQLTENFNYKKLLISEFERVSDVKDFERFEAKFGDWKIVLIALLDKNLELLSKYNDLQCEFRKCPYKKEELKSMEQEVIQSIQGQWFYNGEMVSKDTNELDQLFVAMSSKTVNEKVEMCSQYLSADEVANEKCKDSSYYLSSFQENKNYCDKMEGMGFKRLCIDTYINK